MSVHPQESVSGPSTGHSESNFEATRHLAEYGHVALTAAYSPELAAAVAEQPSLHRIFRPWRTVAKGIETAHQANLRLVATSRTPLDDLREEVLHHVEALGFTPPDGHKRHAFDRLIAIEGHTSRQRHEQNDPAADAGPFTAFTALRGIAHVSLGGKSYDLEPGTLIVADAQEPYAFRAVGSDGTLLHTITGLPSNRGGIF